MQVKNLFAGGMQAGYFELESPAVSGMHLGLQ